MGSRFFLNATFAVLDFSISVVVVFVVVRPEGEAGRRGDEEVREFQRTVRLSTVYLHRIRPYRAVYMYIYRLLDSKRM